MYILPILSLLGYFIAVRRISRWSIETVPFFVISLLASLLYIAGLFDVLPYVAQALVLFGLALLFLSPWYVKQTDWLTSYFTPGFLFIALFCVFFGCFAEHSHLQIWHEFVQWGARAKLIAANQSILTQSTAIEHFEYPPGTALFYYWFFVFSHYSEGVSHLAQQLLIILPLGIFVQGYSWERWQRAFLVVSSAVLILLLLHVPMASGITLDVHYIIGLFLGMMLVSYYYSERRIVDILFLAPAIFFFITIKPDLLGFIILVCMILIVDQFSYQSKNLLLRVSMIVVLFCTALLSHWSWHLFLYQYDVGLIPHFMTWPSLPLSSQQVTMIGEFFRIVEWYLPAVIAIVLLVVANIMLANEQKTRKEIVFLHTFMFIGYLLYLIVLLGVYLYGFGSSGSFYFSSIGNFLEIYYIAWGLLAFATMLPEWRASHFGRQRYLTGGMIALALIAFPVYLFYGHYLHLKARSQQYSLFRLRRSLRPLVVAATSMIPSHARVFVVWQNSAGFEHAVLAYSLIPRDINPQPSSFGKPYGPHDKWTANYTRWHLKQVMRSYNYILLAYTDPPFWRTYGGLFASRRSHQLVQYLICKRDGFSGFGKPGCWTQASVAYLYQQSAP